MNKFDYFLLVRCLYKIKNNTRSLGDMEFLLHNYLSMRPCIILILYINIYMLWFKFILGLKFFELVSFYLPLFQIMEMNTQQKKIKIEPVLKILHQN